MRLSNFYVNNPNPVANKPQARSTQLSFTYLPSQKGPAWFIPHQFNVVKMKDKKEERQREIEREYCKYLFVPSITQFKENLFPQRNGAVIQQSNMRLCVRRSSRVVEYCNKTRLFMSVIFFFFLAEIYECEIDNKERIQIYIYIISIRLIIKLRYFLMS